MERCKDGVSELESECASEKREREVDESERLFSQ